MTVPNENRPLFRAEVIAVLALSALPFLNLSALPPFVDEGVHLWWVLRIVQDGDWLRPLNVGKPFEAWLAGPLVALGGDPLWTMRAVHVLAGVACVWLVYVLTSRVARGRLPVVAALLTAACPFVVYLERMALAEVYLAVAGLLVLCAVADFCLPGGKPAWRSAALLGVALVLAAFAKFPVGFAFIAAMPLALVLGLPSPAERTWLLAPEDHRRWLLAHVPVLLLLAGVASIAVVRTLNGASPGFGLELLQTQVGIRQGPTASGNLLHLLAELQAQLTLPVLALGLLGVAACLVAGSRPQKWTALMGLLPLLGIILFSAEWSGRYVLFAIPPLIVAAVCGWARLLPKSGRAALASAVLLGITIGLMAQQSFLLVTNPPVAGWSEADRGGYIAGWPSGYGYRELAAWLREMRAAAESIPPIYTFDVGTAMQLGAAAPGGDAIEARQIHLVGGRYLSQAEKRDYLLAHGAAWLLAPAGMDPADPWVATHLRRVVGFAKPGSEVEVVLYRVIQ